MLFIYPDNLKAKPKLWLWELRDITVIVVLVLFAALSLASGGEMFLLVVAVLYGFLSIRTDGASILDFLICAARFLFLSQQYFEWRQRESITTKEESH